MNLDKSRVLVLAPHTDDEIHCLGTIKMLLDGGSRIYVHAFSACEESVPDEFPKNILRTEFRSALLSLGVKDGDFSVGSFGVRKFPEQRQTILEVMIRLCADVQPTLVICPSSTDGHQDHRVIYEEACRAFRNCPALIGWEAPHNQKTTVTNFHMSITEEALSAKIAHWAKYRSQGFRRYFSPDFLRALALVRGAQMRNNSTGLAEAFEIHHMEVR